jgi:ribosomal protein L22
VSLQSALENAIRQRELNEKALVESAMLVRDLQTGIRDAIEAIDRKSYQTARQILMQALDEPPWPQRRRERA